MSKLNKLIMNNSSGIIITLIFIGAVITRYYYFDDLIGGLKVSCIVLMSLTINLLCKYYVTNKQ